MSRQAAEGVSIQYSFGEPVAEGKTKKVLCVKGNPDLVILVAKDDITAGDGAKHDVLSGKAAFATRTTCNVFRLLEKCGIPIAFREQSTTTSFVARSCKMLPYEVVVRRAAHGSYLKRNPHLSKGQLFPQLIVEFFLKTSGRRWKKYVEFPCDDPLLVYKPGEVRPMWLFDPSKPIHGTQPFRKLNYLDIVTQPEEETLYPDMIRIARQTFLVLEKAWQIEGCNLVDFKVEFGLAKDGTLLLADVIDNDSWRVLDDGAYIDKQVYRDGGALDDVRAKYQRVADVTDHFRLPSQRIILWRGSEKDAVEPFTEAQKTMGKFLPDNFGVRIVTCSAHKEPLRSVERLHQLLREVPDSVVIAYVGMSNAAGPILSATAMAPVIAVPALGAFHEDVWSSLRVPSNVPLSTILSPANAFLAALRILAMRNPFLYALLAGELEERMMNIVSI